MKRSPALVLALVLPLVAACARHAAPPGSTSYQDLVRLYADWRAFQKPGSVNGVPDYTQAAMDRQRAGLGGMARRLSAIDPSRWPVSEQVDYRLVRAEMNGLDFDHRVLKPWARSPAFYAVIHPDPTDVPAREGNESVGAINLYEYAFPLDEAARDRLRAALRAVPRMLDQAKGNLVLPARDLWFAGMRVKRQESDALGRLGERLRPEAPDLVPDVERARAAVDDFRKWLEVRHAGMTAASGVGVASYDWYMQNVHLVPYSWRQQLDILQRELQRATAALGLEETRNAGVSSQEPPATQVEYQARFDAAVDAFSTFIRQHDVLDLPDYALGALSRRVGPLAPPEARDLFTRVEYADALPMRCHGTHWLDLARMAHEPHPSPIRRSPLLYNIWDSRAEGLATGFEEMMLEAGLFDSRPRARELVYVLLANRAARAMGDLRMHSNEFTIEQAVDYAVAHTPRGWLKRDGGTVWFDEQLYLQQPGYGTSYVIGKVQIERLLAEDRRLSGDRFTLRRFFDRFLGAGMIPVSLIEYEMTGRGPQ